MARRRICELGRPEGSAAIAAARHIDDPAVDRGNHRSTVTVGRAVCVLVACACQAVLIAAPAVAQLTAEQPRFEERFDGPLPTWQVEHDQVQAALVAHRRTAEENRPGGGAEFVQFSTSHVETVRLVHNLPPGLRFDEYSASLRIRSNRRSILLAARVRFPHTADPRTGEPLTIEVMGDPYRAPQQWQELSCPASDTAVREALIRLRSQPRQFPAGMRLDTREAYVDAAVVIVELQPGVSEISLDDLVAGPIITPSRLVTPTTSGSEQPERPRVLIGDDRLRLNGAPFILRFTPHHGERTSVLANCGMNAVWIPDYTDSAVLSELDQAGLYAIAELPVPPGISTHADGDQARVEPLPFSDHPRILFWNIGTRLKPEALPDVSAWSEMVRSADHAFARPLLGEVTGREREFHRRLDCLGVTRHPLQSSMSPLSYLEFLKHKRDLGFPDKPMFTHIQTEPDPGLLKRWPMDRAQPVVEPEQIWLQGYAALAAGYKGIGFWKHTPLTGLEDDERRLAMTLFNRHVELLEPLLAGGKVTEIVPASFTDPVAEAQTGSRWGFLRTESETPAGPVRVSVLESDAGSILLPVWYEPGAQYQPGPMLADELYFRISFKGDDVLQAWLITTTDVTASPVELERANLGHQIRLTGFDQHAAIIITGNMGLIEELRQRIAANLETTSRTWIDLAAAKVRRVESVQTEFVSLGISVEHGEGLLDLARRRLQEAETEFSARRFSTAAHKAQQSLAVLRIFQRAHWDRAVANLSSGVSSPYTICFQTLPEHWRLVERFGTGVRGDNLLKSGDFEDRDTMYARGWIPDPIVVPSIRAESQLRRRNAGQGNYSLHLAAERQTPGPLAPTLDEAALRWISPPVSVYAGQTVFVGGQVRIEESLKEHPDGLLIYETLQGPLGGLRWREPTPDNGDWESFQLLREVHESGELRVVIELRGLGNVSIDDIRVIAIDP